ncbi:class I SAM-dependent methyltransferase [Candidimonas humi]|uniref:Class I SAM-dependent methyltransferase n=1 Tax=Candidimonas humi TaxID=683355 RepID=A0ABV8NYW8_9BURK|nr:class I SAM-dependent methyltransferase [Candidimonas humi]
MKVAGGLKEDGVVVGNTYDKYGSGNPIVRRLMAGFDRTLSGFVRRADPESIHEIGCGEGYWVEKWSREGISARGSDFSKQVIDIAKTNASAAGLSANLFSVCSIYDLLPDRDTADLIVCCEVLEHLEDPHAGLRALQGIVGRHLIVSVPREPLWCGLNLLRGKYVANLGNTPGHIQHWSSSKFNKFVSHYFDVIGHANPLPWTMLLCRPKSS